MSDQSPMSEIRRRLAQAEQENLSLRAELDDARETLIAIQDGQGQVDALVISTPAEEKALSLQRAERPYRALIEQMQQGAAMISHDGAIHYCNRALAEMLNRPLESVIGSSIESHVLADDQAELTLLVRKAMSGHSNGELRLVAANDSTVPAHFSLSSFTEDGSASISVIVSNLSERKRLEQVVANEAFLRRVTDVTPGVLHVFDLGDCRSVFINRTVAAIIGYRPDEIAAMGNQVVPTLMHPDDLPRFVEHLARIQALEDDAIIDFEHRMRDREGKWHWFQSRDAVFARDASGAVRQIIGTAVEITDRKKAEQLLRQSETRLSLGVQVAELALAEVDYDTGVIHLTAEASRLFGLGAAPTCVPRTAVHAIFHPDDKPELMRRVVGSLDPAGTGWFKIDHRIVHPSGDTRWLRVSKQVQFEGNGTDRRPVRAVLAAFDITVEKEAAERIRRSDEFVRGVLDSLPERVVVLDDNGVVSAVNAPWERFARQTGGDLGAVSIGANYLDVCRRASARGDRHASDALDGIQTLIERKSSEISLEYPCHSPDREQWFLMNARRTIHGHSGVIVSHVDITERKKIELELRESQKQSNLLAAIIRDASQPVAFGYADGRLGLLNRAFEELTGYTANELAELGWIEITPPEWRQMEADKLAEQLRTGQPIRYEKEYIRKDGVHVPIELLVHVVLNESGEPDHYYSFVTDITERKLAEAALRNSEQRMRLATEATGVAIWEWDLFTDIVWWDDRMFQLYGVSPTPDGFVPYSVWRNAVVPEDIEAQEQIVQQTIRGRGHGSREFRIRRPGESEWRHIAAVDAIRLNAKGEPQWMVGTNVDITDRRLAEQALRDGEAELRSITTNIPDIVARFDRQKRHVFVNAAVTQATGLPPSAFIGKTNQELWMPPALCDAWDETINAVFESGQPQMLQFSFDTPHSERRYEAKLIPERDAEGKIDHVLTVTRDVTAAWRAAEEIARAKELAEKASAAKDQFLAVLSHELRTPLSPVRMALSIWERQKDALPPQFHDDLAMIRRNVDLECRLIDDMLDLNRIARGKLELQFARVDLHAEVRHAMQTVEEEAAIKQITMSFDPDAARAEVVGDAARLQQVLWNVLKNAVKFTPPGGSVAVRSYNTSKGHIVVAVTDSGAGIEPEAINRIFQAFEQGGAHVTRQFGGLGLGLAISKAIVDMHGGTLVAQSEGSDRGSTFTLELEVAAPPGPSAKDRSSAPKASIGGSISREAMLRILLVEDHKDTAQIMKRLLGSFGYDVNIAASVAEALAASQSTPFDLIISDIGLPDGTGYELMRQIVARRPVAGIALTGYGMEEDVKMGRDAGFVAHLTKPISVEQLELTIRRVMAGVLKLQGRT